MHLPSTLHLSPAAQLGLHVPGSGGADPSELPASAPPGPTKLLSGALDPHAHTPTAKHATKTPRFARIARAASMTLLVTSKGRACAARELP
jgi:hypothetical protein